MSFHQIPGWSNDREERWRTRTVEGWRSWLGRSTLAMKEWTIGQLDRLTSSLSTIRVSGDIHALKLEVRTSSSCGVRVGEGGGCSQPEGSVAPSRIWGTCRDLFGHQSIKVLLEYSGQQLRMLDVLPCQSQSCAIQNARSISAGVHTDKTPS